MQEDNLSKFKEHGKQITGEVKEKSIGYLVAALGFVAGLAWNDAIKSMIEFFFPAQQNTLLAKIIYALGITVIVTLAGLYLARLSRENQEQK